MSEVFPLLEQEEKERLARMEKTLSSEVGKAYVIQKANAKLKPRRSKNRKRKYAKHPKR